MRKSVPSRATDAIQAQSVGLEPLPNMTVQLFLVCTGEMAGPGAVWGDFV